MLKLKILIVDDDLEIVRHLGNAFTTMLKGYQVFTATTANQGLNYIKQEKPDIIVMDVRLGPASGMDLLEDYPKHTTDYRPRLIVITAYPDEKVKKRAEELKVDAFLYKPFIPEVLVTEVAKSGRACYQAGVRESDFVIQVLDKRVAAQSQADAKLNQEIKDNFPEAGASPS